MARAKKIAITVDADLLARAERLRQRTDESRSAVFARALRALLDTQERERRIAEYVEGYRRQPETQQEIGWVDAASVAGVEHVPWDAGDDE